MARSTGGAFSTIASLGTNSATDSGRTADTTYVYKVRAVDSSGNVSAYSTVDAATTIVFTDDPLVAGTTVVKAVHLTQLRTAVNAMGTAAGLVFSFTDSTLTAMPIKAVHISELRTALDDARRQIGLPAIGYTDPALTTRSTAVKAAHVQEIRNGCK